MPECDAQLGTGNLCFDFVRIWSEREDLVSSDCTHVILNIF